MIGTYKSAFVNGAVRKTSAAMRAAVFKYSKPLSTAPKDKARIQRISPQRPRSADFIRARNGQPTA
jgi:hypothetical protein